MSEKLCLKIGSEVAELAHITAAIESLAEREEWPPDLVFKVNLVLEELTLNTMTHGSHKGLGEIEIRVDSAAEALTIEIMDNGRPFDPLTDAPTPDVDGALGERSVGGLGIHLVREMMDEMRYRREEGRNCLTLVTRRTG